MSAAFAPTMQHQPVLGAPLVQYSGMDVKKAAKALKAASSPKPIQVQSVGQPLMGVPSQLPMSMDARSLIAPVQVGDAINPLNGGVVGDDTLMGGVKTEFDLDTLMPLPGAGMAFDLNMPSLSSFGGLASPQAGFDMPMPSFDSLGSIMSDADSVNSDQSPPPLQTADEVSVSSSPSSPQSPLSPPIAAETPMPRQLPVNNAGANAALAAANAALAAAAAAADAAVPKRRGVRRNASTDSTMTSSDSEPTKKTSGRGSKAAAKKDLPVMANSDEDSGEGEEGTGEKKSKRERNKVSAMKYRKRRKVYIDSLEGKLVDLTDTVSTLSAENKLLKEQLDFVKNLMCVKGGDLPPQLLSVFGSAAGKPGVTAGTVPVTAAATRAPKRASATSSGGRGPLGGAGGLAMFAIMCCVLVAVPQLMPFSIRGGSSVAPTADIPSPVSRSLLWNTAEVVAPAVVSSDTLASGGNLGALSEAEKEAALANLTATSTIAPAVDIEMVEVSIDALPNELPPLSRSHFGVNVPDLEGSPDVVPVA